MLAGRSSKEGKIDDVREERVTGAVSLPGQEGLGRGAPVQAVPQRGAQTVPWWKQGDSLSARAGTQEAESCKSVPIASIVPNRKWASPGGGGGIGILRRKYERILWSCV